MARTMAMRVGPPGSTLQLTKMLKDTKKVDHNQAKQTAIKALAQSFITNELKMPMTEWKKLIL